MGDKSGAENEFERAMRQLGVRRMDEQKTEKTRVLDQEGHDAPISQDVSAKPPREVGGEEIATLRTEIDALRRELAQSRNDQERLAEAFASESEDLRTTYRETDATMLLDLLKEHKLDGQVAEAEWVGQLIEGKSLRRLFSVLEVRHPAALSQFIVETLIRHCGREECGAPSHLLRITVDPEQCEICGGACLENWEDQLSGILMLNGLRRIQLVGAKKDLLQWFANRIDGRIDVRVAGLSTAENTGDSDRTVLLWRLGGEDASSIKADYRIKATSLGQFVQRVGYRFEGE